MTSDRKIICHSHSTSKDTLKPQKQCLPTLPTNIRIDRSINRKLYCFVTKMAKLNLVCHVCFVVIRPRGVSQKDGLLALPTNIRIDHSINRNLFCFVTKMAQLNLVCHVSLIVIRPCGVSRKDRLLALLANIRIDRSININLFCFVTKNLGLLSILKSILNFKTLFNLILYNVECVYCTHASKMEQHNMGREILI